MHGLCICLLILFPTWFLVLWITIKGDKNIKTLYCMKMTKILAANEEEAVFFLSLLQEENMCSTRSMNKQDWTWNWYGPIREVSVFSEFLLNWRAWHCDNLSHLVMTSLHKWCKLCYLHYFKSFRNYHYTNNEQWDG